MQFDLLHCTQTPANSFSRQNFSFRMAVSFTYGKKSYNLYNTSDILQMPLTLHRVLFTNLECLFLSLTFLPSSTPLRFCHLYASSAVHPLKYKQKIIHIMHCGSYIFVLYNVTTSYKTRSFSLFTSSGVCIGDTKLPRSIKIKFSAAMCVRLLHNLGYLI